MTPFSALTRKKDFNSLEAIYSEVFDLVSVMEQSPESIEANFFMSGPIFAMVCSAPNIRTSSQIEVHPTNCEWQMYLTIHD
jgi:hypothetical protein